MSKEGSPSRLEMTLADEATVTSRTWQELSQIYGSLDFVPGVSVLDIGGGGSDLTAHLLEAGFDARAIDPLYRQRSQVKGLANKHLEALARRFKRDSSWTEWIALIEARREALETFIASSKANPSRYVYGYATQLPFKDESFDVVLSTNCITEYLDLDPNLLTTAVSEAIRVTKPEGAIYLHPFQDTIHGQMDMMEAGRQMGVRRLSQEGLITWLDNRDVPHEILMGASSNPSLKIIRPVSF